MAIKLEGGLDLNGRTFFAASLMSLNFISAHLRIFIYWKFFWKLLVLHSVFRIQIQLDPYHFAGVSFCRIRIRIHSGNVDPYPSKEKLTNITFPKL